MKTITGTSHFSSKEAAIQYYLPYYGKDELMAAAAVTAKLQAGEIHLGKPTTGKVLLHLDEGRYYNET